MVTPGGHDENRDDSKGQWCRVFNQAAVLKGRFTLRDTGITVDDVLQALDSGLETSAVLAKFPALQARDIDLCRSIAVHHMPGRPEHDLNKGGMKILLDENVGHSVIPRLLNARAEFSHISFHGLTSAMDGDIYAYARAKGFSVVITHDRDFLSLTRLEVMREIQKSGRYDAPAARKLPFIAHVSPEVLHSGQFEKTVAAAIDRILLEASRKPRAMAWLGIEKDGVVSGPDARGIYESFLRGTARDAMPDKPVFDMAFLDGKRIDDLCRTARVPLIPITTDPAQDAHLARLKNRPPRP